MAKLRFPGKALKLNQRKRTKFNHSNELTPEEVRLIQIKKGLRLFRSVFGDSEEDDFEGFIPIYTPEESKHALSQFKYKQKKNNATEQHLKCSNKKSDERPLPNKSNGKRQSNTIKPLHKQNRNAPEQVNTTNRCSEIQFTLPNKSARSSRIIIPNRRIFDNNITSIKKSHENKLSSQADSLTNGISPDNEDSSEGDVPISISLYADGITEEPETLPSRHSKRLSGNQGKDPQSRQKKIREKIEKLLRSPWDSRLKQAPSQKQSENKQYCDRRQSLPATETDILRKPRLNLSKKTLQKIRSTSSIKELHPFPIYDDGSDGKCGFCQLVTSSRMDSKYGIGCCESCSASIQDMVESEDSSKVCIGTNGECQLMGLSYRERCKACWIGRVLQSCTMPSLLHDRLRKQLPDVLKDIVPTSLGRSYNKSGMYDTAANEAPLDNTTFVSTVNLPGGWKRKLRGASVTVISPTGEKFRSIAKLAVFLQMRGISADATVLFGNPMHAKTTKLQSFSEGDKSGGKNGASNVVVTTLPGGWERRIKWPSSGDKFDTYVCSPDGKTFKCPKDLYAYFQRIGKRDDIHKYFPVNNYENSNDNSDLSSCDPYSSTELFSDATSEGQSPYHSEGDDNDAQEDLSSDQSCSESDAPSNQIVISNFETDASGTERIYEPFEEDSCGEEINKDVSAINIMTILSAEENDLTLDDTAECDEDTNVLGKRIILAKDLYKYVPCPKSRKQFNKKMIEPTLESNNHKNSSNYYSSLDNLVLTNDGLDESKFILNQSLKNSDDQVVAMRKYKLKSICDKKLPTFTTERFGKNWSRKIKWDAESNGKISYLTNPEGQKIHSTIELMAYFKKAGKPTHSIEHYFPTTLIRPEIKPKPEKKIPKEKQAKIKNISLDLKGESSDINKLKGSQARRSLEKTINQIQGPRVKNVCRSAAQALSLPRAVFPKENSQLKIQKKMITCKRCTGCLKGDCRQCSNCLDMKKYGGKGSKRKRCILRKCLHPKKVDKSVEISPESDVSGIQSDTTNYDNLNHQFQDDDSSRPGSPLLVGTKSSKNSRLKKGRHKKTKAIERVHQMDDGVLLNIDYWHDYCTEDTAMTGFPIITTELPEVEAFCFRCGSAGQEELIFCSLCCEGIHPFCLEEGELHESQIDCAEDIWVCRRCVVCHVCGTAGCEQLIQCSVCIKYFHLDCIGPSHHATCQDNMNDWERDLFATLGRSWVQPNILYEAEDDVMIDMSSVEILEELQCPRSETTFNYVSMPPSGFVSSPRKKQAVDNLVQSVRIDEEELNLEEEGDFTICLEDEYEVAKDNMATEQFLKLTLNTDMDAESSRVSNHLRATGMGSRSERRSLVNEHSSKAVIDKEYQTLKYRRIFSSYNCKPPLSLHTWMNFVYADLFDTLEYPSWDELVDEGLLPYKSRYLMQEKESEQPDITDAYNSRSMKAIIQQRRADVKEYLKDVHEAEKRQIEMENQAFKAWRTLLKKKARERNQSISKESSPLQTPHASCSEDEDSDSKSCPSLAEENLILYEHPGCVEWQPANWDDFDIMMSVYMTEYPEAELELKEIIDSGVYADVLDHQLLGSKDELETKRRSKDSPHSDAKRFKFDGVVLSPRTMTKTLKRAESSICTVNLTKIDFAPENCRRSRFNVQRSKTEGNHQFSSASDNRSGSNNVHPSLSHSGYRSSLETDSPSSSKISPHVLSIGDAATNLKESDQSGLNNDYFNHISTDLDQSQIEGIVHSEGMVPLCKDGVDVELNEIINSNNEACNVTINASPIVVDNNKQIEVDFRTRPRRRTFGRASELASLRKSKMDM